MKKSEKVIVWGVFTACALAFLVLLDIDDNPSILEGWQFVAKSTLRWPPFFGHGYLIVDRGSLEWTSRIFLISALALVLSGFWFLGRGVQRMLMGREAFAKNRVRTR